MAETGNEPRRAKRALRREMILRLRAIPFELRFAQESAIVASIGDVPGLARGRTILLYAAAFPEEIATAPIFEHAIRLGKRLIYPRVDRVARRLKLHEVRDLRRDLVTGALGIPEPRLESPEIEPSLIDWALVPGLAFDAQGFRLGRGGGYYDRLLPTLRPDAMRWAIALQEQVLEDLPREPHDQPIDGIAMASGRLVASHMRITR